MPISEAEWASVTGLIEKKVADKGEAFTTGQVIKRDPDRRVIWTRDFGDEPIPVVAFSSVVRTFDSTPAGVAVRNLEANVIIPQIGDTVLIARELGTRRLLRCLGVIDGAGIVPGEAGLKDVGTTGPPGGQVNQTYAVTAGYTKDRAINPEATSLTEVARVLGTLIDDMKASGLIKP